MGHRGRVGARGRHASADFSSGRLAEAAGKGAAACRACFGGDASECGDSVCIIGVVARGVVVIVIVVVRGGSGVVSRSAGGREGAGGREVAQRGLVG